MAGSERNELAKISSHDAQTSLPTLPFSSWLPSFYDELLLYLEQGWKWCMVAFPDDYKTLVPKLLIETMTTLSASFMSRINTATGDVVPETKSLETLKSVFLPYESFKQKFSSVLRSHQQFSKEG